MKKILLLLMLMPSMLAYAQHHLKFKGVEMNGSIIAFADSLKKKGFIVDDQDENIIWMKGTFVNEDVNIGILSTPKTHIVCRLIVVFNKKDDWYSLKSQYNILKDNYEIKYEKDADYSFFSDPYYEGDGYEMTAVKSNKCRYTSFFKGEDGGINLEISKLACVVIVYEDFKNTQLEKIEKRNIAIDDI